MSAQRWTRSPFPEPSDPSTSIPKSIVWQESSWPRQWIGMHEHVHVGGIRCNSRAEAERFMRDLCGSHGCAWTESSSP